MHPIFACQVAALVSIHERHALPPACYVAHSYGTMVVAKVLLTQPQLVGSTALVDPVCFLLCLPDVVYNFIYRWVSVWVRRVCGI